MSNAPKKSGVGLLLVSHGNLAAEFLDAAGRILGAAATKAVPVCVDWATESAAAKEQIRKALRKLQEENAHILILTDLFGGTPSNISLSFLKTGKIEVVTGVNLPMLLKVSDLRGEKNLTEFASLIRDYGKKNIYLASEVLNREVGGQK